MLMWHISWMLVCESKPTVSILCPVFLSFILESSSAAVQLFRLKKWFCIVFNARKMRKSLFNGLTWWWFIIVYHMNTKIKEGKRNAHSTQHAVIQMPNKIELFWLSEVMMKFWQSFTLLCKLPIWKHLFVRLSHCLDIIICVLSNVPLRLKQSNEWKEKKLTVSEIKLCQFVCRNLVMNTWSTLRAIFSNSNQCFTVYTM